MSEGAERYARIARGFDARVAGLAGDAWTAPTPCSEWNVRDLVGHVVSVHRQVIAGLDASAPPPPAADADLIGAWHGATAEIVAALADPERASAPVTGRFAPMTLDDLIGRLLCSDTLVHTWDLSRATGQDEELDTVGVTYAFTMLLPADDAIRGPGSFGPKIEPPPDADEQTRFLCFLGRSASSSRPVRDGCPR
ncbi:MAG: TIGR03086 family metal-binding protein [Acidimicrobiia bacterium]